jgi:carbon-monoxide dehydrogenase medium subunit
MALWRHYHLPLSVDEALMTLTRYAGGARIVAGGTDLLLELQQGRKPPVEALVDVTRVPEMNVIAEEGALIHVGAAVTHTRIVASELLARAATCLVESCGVIGGPQVRNVATLGGNVAHALPAGDGTLSLVALDAEAEVASRRPDSQTFTREWRPILSLYKGPGKSALDHTRELIVRFRFRAAQGNEATAYKRIMRPQGVALPILALAVWVNADSIVNDVRLVLGPAGPAPLRAVKAETYLSGIPLVKDVLPQIADLIVQEAQLRTSPHRATADYRRELVQVLVERALPLAVRRAQTGEVVPEGIGEG